MRNNPMDADAAKKAYASAQYSEVMDINRFAEHIGVKSKQVLESSSLSTIFSNVVAGMGVACFPKSCISFYKTRFPVYSYELPEPYTRMEWSLICRKDTYLTKPMKELIREAQRGKPYIRRRRGKIK